MTALNLVAQPKHNLLHLLHDSALYADDLGVVAFGSKSIVIPHWPGFVTGVGIAASVPSFAYALAQGGAFDEVIEKAPAILPALIAAGDWGKGGEVLIGGISAERGPEYYSFRLTETLPPGVTLEEARASGFWGDAPGSLTKLPGVIMTPVPSMPDVIAAKFEGIDPDADPDLVVWSMRKHLEMQRHMKLPDGVGYIGGFATLTTVSPEGVRQRVVDRWADVAGTSFDWDKWHRSNPKPKPRLHLFSNDNFSGRTRIPRGR